MKFDKNFFIPFSIITGMFVLVVVFQKAPVIPILSLLLFVYVPTLYLIQKTNYDWGKVYIIGILLAIIYIALSIGLVELANHYEWLKDILFWPTNWREA